VEYNMINNIPILYPHKPNNVLYAPRYTIADADKILHCFDKGKSTINIHKTMFRYIRVSLDKNFKTLDDVKALYYYVMVDNTIDFDGFDFTNSSSVLRWLRKHQSNHYILVTTPVLQNKYTYYNVANDNDFKIIEHTAIDLINDEKIFIKLLKNNCYTICDNYNIVISLYQKLHIDKSTFVSIIKLLNHLKHFYYTPSVWMYLINNHRLLSACDIPMLHISLTPHLITDDNTVLNTIEPNLRYLGNQNAYMQTCHKTNILFTTFISSSYPNTNLRFLKTILGENVSDVLWFNYTSLPKHYWMFAKESTFVNDLFGLFAAFVHKDDMWQYWCENKVVLLSNLKNQYRDSKHFLFDVLCPLFRLYNVGYEGITIKRKRVHYIWNDVLNQQDISASYTVIADIFQCLAVLNTETCSVPLGNYVPYVFLLDIHQKFSIDFGKEMFIQNIHSNKIIYRLSTIYHMLNSRRVHDSFYYFHRNVLKKRGIYILMCIYKKFGLLRKSDANPKLEAGRILINYFQENMNYLC
jgi:hypothetical protein